MIAIKFEAAIIDSNWLPGWNQYGMFCEWLFEDNGYTYLDHMTYEVNISWLLS